MLLSWATIERRPKGGCNESKRVKVVRPERFELPTFWFVVSEVDLVSCGLSCPYNLPQSKYVGLFGAFCSLNVPKWAGLAVKQSVVFLRDRNGPVGILIPSVKRHGLSATCWASVLNPERTPIVIHPRVAIRIGVHQLVRLAARS